MNPEPTQSERTALIWIWIILLAIVTSWAMYWAWVTPYVTESKFDPLNALFSGLAFWGVIYAILLQRNELALQRKELELTRNEVRGQKEQLKAQNVTLEHQRFENTFFSLLNLFSDLVNSIEIGQPLSGNSLKGRACFSLFFNEFQNAYGNVKMETKSQDLLVLCKGSYDRFAGSRQIYVGHYFRTLYNIIKFVANSEVGNKQIYVNLVRAQLSSPELNLLFYNCLSDYGNKKFKPFVEQFGLLENMELSHLLDPRHKDLYLESAFKSPS